MNAEQCKSVSISSQNTLQNESSQAKIAFYTTKNELLNVWILLLGQCLCKVPSKLLSISIKRLSRSSLLSHLNTCGKLPAERKHSDLQS